jgi:Cu+-exporting ATPase
MLKKDIFKIIGMHCTSCAMNIDGELEDTEGVREANTNYAKSQTEVIYDPEQISLQKISKIIEQLDYKTEVLK